MSSKVFLGIDTSNYTTSLAAVSESGEVLASVKRLLPVKDGELGLRQSDALFHHTAALPELFSLLRAEIGDAALLAVGASEKPRNIEGSYMPCFLAGVSAAAAISASLPVALYRFSHQCGHLMAAIHSAGRYELLQQPFAAFHVSGGTTEFLSVTPRDGGFLTSVIGGTRDLNAGQLVDRIGVMLGLRFPCGQALERLAEENENKLPPRKLSVDGTYINLSGLQNLAEKLYRETGDKALVADFVLTFLAESLSAICQNYEAEHGKSRFLFAGGVMSNQRIRAFLTARYDASFAEPELSRDNAVGTALLTRLSYLK